MEERMEMLAVENLEKNEFMNIYTCKICSRQFKRKFTAKLHVESKHFPSINGYYCKLCDILTPFLPLKATTIFITINDHFQFFKL